MFAISKFRVSGMLLLCIPLSMRGQPRCKMDHYTTEDGLSSDRITSIIKDDEGFMWFGTWDGIDRFDGHNFVTYKSYPGDLSQLKNNRIDQIVEDKTCYLWLKDYDKQVYRFDKRTEQFLPLADIIRAPGSQKFNFERIISNDKGTVWLLTHDRGVFFIPNTDLREGRYLRYGAGLKAPYRLPSNRINFFFEDQSGDVWMGTPTGLAHLVKDKTGGYVNAGIGIAVSADTGENFTAVAEDVQNVYFSTVGGRFFVYNKASRSWRTRRLPVSGLNGLCVSKKAPVVYCSTAGGQVLRIAIADLAVRPTGFRAGEPVYGIYEDRTGCLWVEPSVEGIFRYDPSSGMLNKYTQKRDARYTYKAAHTRVFEDNKGIVWAVLKNFGFGYYDHSAHSFEYFYDGPDPATHRFSNMVTCLYYDKSGILWLSSDMLGINKIIFPDNHFDQHLLVNNTTLRTDNEVRGIYTDRQNRLWIGTKMGKLYVRKEGREVRVRFINEPAEGFGQVYSILQDHTGVVWLGTKQNGLFRAEPVDSGGTTYTISHFREDEKDVNSINGDDVYTLAEDKHGRIWAGTFDKGLNEVVTINHRTSFISTKNSFPRYPQNSFNKIRHIAFDRDDNLWIGTTSGLLIMEAPDGNDPRNDRFVSYGKAPGDKESLGNNDVQFIFMDSHHTIWLLTAGGGLCRALGDHVFKALKFRNYTVDNGLSNDYLLSCLEDDRDNLWLATQKGIARFNTVTGQIRNYDSDDGLLNSAYSEASCTKLADGSMVFGTIKGYLEFNPETISDHKIETGMALTNLQVNNEDRAARARDSILKYNIDYTNALRLNYYQNNISIDYMVLDYRTVNKQDYLYRLNGFDTMWHSNQQQRRATYNNLAPGSYVFEVKSKNGEQYTHLPERSLAITILPPPWRTWWAYLLYLLSGVIILMVIRRNALAMFRLRQRIAVEQRITELKLNFFTNISHELRTPLTLILNPIQQIAGREDLSQQGKAHIQIVQRNANRMVRFINQLLDLRKVQSGKATMSISKVDIVSFIARIAEYFADMGRERRVSLDIKSDRDEVYVFVDAEKMDIVIYNLLANAFKFSPPGKRVLVDIRQPAENEHISIRISDEGSGVPEEMLKDIFELYFVDSHSNGNNMKGSGIGLALSREMIALHQGKIWAENNREHGLSVVIELMPGKAHFPAGETLWVDLPEAIRHTPGETSSAMGVIEGRDAFLPAADLPVVLLVEDNFELQGFLKSQLGQLFHVEVASNGEEGLQKAETLLPDLILSDVMMPRMDGIKMLGHLKNNTHTSHIPVVLLSAKSSVENQIEGLQYGADLYLTKPFNNELLMASLSNLLHRRKLLFESIGGKRQVSFECDPTAIQITSKDEDFLKRVIKLVEDGMGDADFSIDSMAESMNMARSTFYKKFKSLTNLTVVEFVRDMRLKRGRQFLDAGETNISSIAYAVGFNDAKYFSTCFKEKFTISPTEYLKANGRDARSQTTRT
ncbi:MAG TPA: two-component regulator propeller domain-containing protein [Puia sp.]|nr:two-component regulator propeller domain-containing protein [Puia sp.]